MTDLALFPDELETLDHDRLDAHETFYTPIDVVRQGIVPYIPPHPEARFLDPSAGAGVFGQVVLEVNPRIRGCAIEPRDEEIEGLRRHYDAIHHGHVPSEVTLEFCRACGPFDLIATNPPFSKAVLFVHLFVPMLTVNGVLVLLMLSDWGQRSEYAAQLFDELPPSFEHRIHGSIKYRGPGRDADMRSYSWWVWEAQRRERKSWYSSNLPKLEAHKRAWKQIPGTT